MSIFKCKMCGGTIEYEHGASVGVCGSCGTKQTLPKLDNEKKIQLLSEANKLRLSFEFDKAAEVCENIISEFPGEPEAYWVAVLCIYGIEYVEDPASDKRVPSVNRTRYVSIFADENYKSAMEKADASQKIIYEEEARQIDKIRKEILEISRKEKPYDVFICCNEVDTDGRKTVDAVLAAELYHRLTEEGCRVFFPRITLEDKSGAEYEPYIFAALNSAKVMVVLGTKAEHFGAARVKNEWSRYLSLIKSGADKTLVSAYRNMDPLDLPDEFLNLRIVDISDPGLMQDLIQSVKEITITADAQGKIPDRQNIYRRISDFFKSITDAVKAKMNKKRVAIIAASTVAAAVLFLILVVNVIIPGINYKKALAAVDAGNYGEAYTLFGECSGYKDADSKLLEITPSYYKEKFANVKAGDIITFGSYEQDNDTRYGKEDTEWRVLEVKDGKALIISNKVLDCKPYNTELNSSVTWTNSSLRIWLNNEFLKSAFSEGERSIISGTDLKSDDTGSDTTDKIFVLSESEAEEYFSSDEDRICGATAYAKSSGATCYDKGAYWWLRTRGTEDFAYYTYYSGYIYTCSISRSGVGVRPALWIEI